MIAYVRKLPLPEIRFNTMLISEAEIVDAIIKSTENLGKRVLSFAGSLWNVEGEAVGARFEQISLGGGGAYYLGPLRKITSATDRHPTRS